MRMNTFFIYQPLGLQIRSCHSYVLIIFISFQEILVYERCLLFDINQSVFFCLPTVHHFFTRLKCLCLMWVPCGFFVSLRSTFSAPILLLNCFLILEQHYLHLNSSIYLKFHAWCEITLFPSRMRAAWPNCSLNKMIFFTWIEMPALPCIKSPWCVDLCLASLFHPSNSLSIPKLKYRFDYGGSFVLIVLWAGPDTQ